VKQTKILIAIDGPAASGKGTVARLLGEKLSFPVLYTGNIYRAVAHKLLVNKIDPHNINEAINFAKNLKLEDLENNPELNLEQVGQYASIIGVYPELRKATYDFQRNFITENQSSVIEGRDIGTVICPEANFKFYITADVEVRAKRRSLQQSDIAYETILADLKLRDERDMNRAVAPLKPADDAIIIDNSEMDIKQTLNELLERILDK
jgi:cytidylate kinase